MRPSVCALGLVCVLLAALATLSSEAAAAPTATPHYGRSARSSRPSPAGAAASFSSPRAFRTLGTAAANDAAVAEYCSRATLDISIPNVLSLSHSFADGGSPLSVQCDPRSFAFNVAPDTRAAGVSVDIPGGDRQASNAWVEVSNGGRGYTEEAQNPTMYVDLDGVRDMRFTVGGAYMGSFDCRADPEMDQDAAYCGYCAVGPFVVQCVDPTLGFASRPALVVSAIDGVAASSDCSTCVTIGSAQACNSGVALEWSLLPAADPSLTDNAFCGPFGAPPCTSLYERWFDAFDVQIFETSASSQPALVLTLPAVKAREDGTARLEIRGGAMSLISASGSTAVTTGDPSNFLADGSRQYTVRFFNPVTQRTSDASAATSYRVETVCTQPAVSSSTGTSGPPPPSPPGPPVGEFEESSTVQEHPVLPSSTATVAPLPPSSTGADGAGIDGPSAPSPPPSAGDMETGEPTGSLPVPVDPTQPSSPSTGSAGEQQSTAPPSAPPQAVSSSAVAAAPPSGSSSSGLAPVNDASGGARFSHTPVAVSLFFAAAISLLLL